AVFALCSHRSPATLWTAASSSAASIAMSRKRTLQQGALAIAFSCYVGYVALDRFALHDETALENAKRRGRLRGEANVRRRLIEEDAAEAAAAAAAAAEAAAKTSGGVNRPAFGSHPPER
ncbi:unnamed protein product, partial [Pylaiella littoralis]